MQLLALCISLIFIGHAASTQSDGDSGERKRVLVYAPGFAGSLWIFHHNIARLLAEHGFDVTLYFVGIIPFDSKKLEVDDRIDFIYNHQAAPDVEQRMMDMIADAAVNNTWRLRNSNYFMNLMAETCTNLTKDAALLQRLAGRKFDIALIHISARFSEAGEEIWVICKRQSIALNSTWPDIASFIGQRYNLFTETCRNLATDDVMMARLAGRKFDIALVHIIDLCGFSLAHQLGIPATIAIGPGSVSEHVCHLMGIPVPWSTVPATNADVNYLMDSKARMKNSLWHVMTGPLYAWGTVRNTNAIFREQFGADFPSVAELVYKSKMFFINAEEFVDFPRPTMSKYVFIAGVGQQAAKPLNKEWQKRANNLGKKGFVVFSLGSVLRPQYIPEEWEHSLTNAFAQFPDYHFYIRLTANKPRIHQLKLPSNVELVSWLPQRALLEHPRCRAFVTHAGFNSIQEATHAGVPLLTIPLFADQYSNSNRVRKHGVGLRLDKENITTNSLVERLGRLLGNGTYTKESKMLQRMIKEKPFKPDDVVVGWVRFWAEFPFAENFQPASAQLSFVEYFLIDTFYASGVYGEAGWMNTIGIQIQLPDNPSMPADNFVVRSRHRPHRWNMSCYNRHPVVCLYTVFYSAEAYSTLPTE